MAQPNRIDPASLDLFQPLNLAQLFPPPNEICPDKPDPVDDAPPDGATQTVTPKRQDVSWCTLIMSLKQDLVRLGDGLRNGPTFDPNLLIYISSMSGQARKHLKGAKRVWKDIEWAINRQNQMENKLHISDNIQVAYDQLCRTDIDVLLSLIAARQAAEMVADVQMHAGVDSSDGYGGSSGISGGIGV